MSYGVNTGSLKTTAIPFSTTEIKNFGTTLVFAPHPDDESLACGGLIAMLGSIENQVYVIFVSDGSLSHPGSQKFPAAALANLREEEALEALSHLGVPNEMVFFMGIKDGSVPHEGVSGFDPASETIASYLSEINPHTIIIPWRRDTHKDHRACWQLVNNALAISGQNVLTLEYPLWLWERGEDGDLPGKNEMDLRSVDISVFLGVKILAIHAHRSQVTRMIDDDPGGFWLSPEVIAHFTVPEEIYLVEKKSM